MLSAYPQGCWNLQNSFFTLPKPGDDIEKRHGSICHRIYELNAVALSISHTGNVIIHFAQQHDPGNYVYRPTTKFVFGISRFDSKHSLPDPTFIGNWKPKESLVSETGRTVTVKLKTISRSNAKIALLEIEVGGDGLELFEGNSISRVNKRVRAESTYSGV